GEGGGVHGVLAGHLLQQVGGVADVAGERAHLVQRGREGDQAVAADQPAGRFGPRGSAQRRSAGPGWGRRGWEASRIRNSRGGKPWRTRPFWSRPGSRPRPRAAAGPRWRRT